MSKVYLAGIDTLAVGFHVDEFLVNPEEWALLADAKASAQGRMFGSGGSPVVFKGHKFSVSPKGSHGYEYVLVNDDVTIQLAERATGGSAYPEIHVTWRSQYLWRNTWQGAYTYVARWIRSWARGEVEKVSRADLCIDVGMELPEVNLKVGEAVSYARNKREFYVENHFRGMEETGYRFGQGDLLCRVYNKIAETAVHDKAWFLPMWRRNGWDGESPVTRVEFQSRRDHLKSQQIETVEDLERQLADLWRYFTEWVSLRDQDASDSNRRRWPVKDFWRVVCGSVAEFGKVTGVCRLTQRKPRIDALSKLGRGVMVTMTALFRTTYEDTPGHPITVQQAIGWLKDRAFMEWVSDPEFLVDVDKRAAKLAAMT